MSLRSCLDKVSQPRLLTVFMYFRFAVLTVFKSIMYIVCFLVTLASMTDTMLPCRNTSILLFIIIIIIITIIIIIIIIVMKHCM